MNENVSDIKRKSLTGFMWRMGEGVIAQGMTFVVGMVLARLLSPTEFGLVALSTLFLAVVNVFADCGLGQALIQKKNTDELDSNTVFYAGLGVVAVLYVLVFMFAPLVADLFGQPPVANLIRVAALTMFLSSYNSVQTAEISRNLDFKKFFYIGIVCSGVSGIIGLCLAFAGYGVWALIAQSMSYTITRTIMLNRIIRWIPKPQFSFERFRGLFSYGVNLMVAGVIGMIFNQMKGFLIGLRYQPADLSYYNRGESMPSILCNNINGTINQIMLPALSKLQDEPMAMKAGIRRSMMLSSYVLVPMMFGLVAVAKNVIVILFSDKWLPAVPFLQVIAVGYCFSILSSTNLMAINAIGRSDITLKLEFIKKPIYLALLLAGMHIGPLAIAAAVAINSILAMIFNAWPNRKLIHYSLLEQWKDVYPQFLLSFVMCAIVWVIGMLNWNIYLLFFTQVAIGSLFYIGSSRVFDLNAYRYAHNTLINLLQKR